MAVGVGVGVQVVGVVVVLLLVVVVVVDPLNSSARIRTPLARAFLSISLTIACRALITERPAATTPFYPKPSQSTSIVTP